MAIHCSQKRFLAVATAALALVAVAAHGAPRQNTNAAPAAPTAPANQSQTAQPSADLGSISGNVYTNDSLGMAYEFPKGWFVDHAWMDMANRPQDPGPRPADPAEQAKYDATVAAMQSTHALLAVSEHTADTPGGGGPRIQLSVSPVFENKTGADILNGMKSMYGHMRLIQIVDDPADYTFGGADVFPNGHETPGCDLARRCRVSVRDHRRSRRAIFAVSNSREHARAARLARSFARLAAIQVMSVSGGGSVSD